MYSWRCILFARVAKRVFNLCFPSFYSNPSGKPSSCLGRFFTCSGPVASFFHSRRQSSPFVGGTRVGARRTSASFRISKMVSSWALSKSRRVQQRTTYTSYHIRPLPLFPRPPFTTPPQYPPHAQYQLATHPPGTVDSTYQKLSCRADLCGSCMQHMR